MALDLSSYGIERLSVSERWELLDHILASLPPVEGSIELTAEQIAEIKRRQALADADPERGRPWRDAIAEIRAEL